MSTAISIKAEFEIDVENTKSYALPSSLENRLHAETFEDITRSINDIAQHIGMEPGDEMDKPDPLKFCKCCRNQFCRMMTGMLLMAFCFLGAAIGLFVGFANDSPGGIYFGYVCCGGFVIGIVFLASLGCNGKKVERRDLCLDELRTKIAVINKRAQGQIVLALWAPTLEIELKADKVRFCKDFLYVPNGCDIMREPPMYSAAKKIAWETNDGLVAVVDNQTTGGLDGEVMVEDVEGTGYTLQ